MKGSLGLSMQASESWANLPATTRPLQRVRPEAAGGRIATGSNRQSRPGWPIGPPKALLRDGEEVGDEGGTCPIVDVEQGLIHCTVTMRLPGGQLTFQALTTTAPTKQLAITGGTGRYQGVGGEATLAELGDGTGTLTVRLRR